MVGGKPISDDAKKTHLEKKKKISFGRRKREGERREWNYGMAKEWGEERGKERENLLCLVNFG